MSQDFVIHASSNGKMWGLVSATKITSTTDCLTHIDTLNTKMPRLYLIVRLESTEASTKPSYKIHDISITGVPAALSDDPTRMISTYTVIDEQSQWTYLAAIQINEVDCGDVHISYGTLSRGEAMHILEQMPGYIKEIDKTRHKVARKTPATVEKAGDVCINIKLRDGQFLWYEVVTVDAVDREMYKTQKKDVDKGEDKKRRKVKV
jgi:hypothetical protein